MEEQRVATKNMQVELVLVFDMEEETKGGGLKEQAHKGYLENILSADGVLEKHPAPTLRRLFSQGHIEICEGTPVV
jgi:hypothetical protein